MQWMAKWATVGEQPPCNVIYVAEKTKTRECRRAHRKLIPHLNRGESLTSERLSSQIGLAKNTAERYLRYLRHEGVLELIEKKPTYIYRVV